MSKLIGKIDEIIELFIKGKSYRDVADIMDVPLTTLHDFTSKSEHSARIREALEYSASSFDDKAEQILLDCPPDRDAVSRARELAQHYRWKASKRSPKKYGDKLDITTDGDKITTPVITAIDKDGKVIDGKLK